MKRFISSLFLAAGYAIAQTGDSPPGAAAATNGPVVTAVDGYAARVDSTIITYGEVRESVAPYLQQAVQKLQGEELAREIQKAFIDAREALIEEALLKEEVKTLGLTLPDTFIDQEVERLVRERFDGDRALLARALAARRITLEEWRQEVAGQLALRIFYNQEVTQRARVSQQAVRDEYERTRDDYFRPLKIKYRLIAVSKGGDAEEAVRKKELLEDALQRLRNGTDFAALAETVSEGDAEESPWREIEEVRGELRPALLETPVGRVSDLIETERQLFIVKVEARREEGYAPFEEVRPAIEARLRGIEQSRLHRQLMDRLAAGHFIERY